MQSSFLLSDTYACTHTLSNDIRVSGTDIVIYINICFYVRQTAFIEPVKSHFHANQKQRTCAMTLRVCRG